MRKYSEKFFTHWRSLDISRQHYGCQQGKQTRKYNGNYMCWLLSERYFVLAKWHNFVPASRDRTKMAHCLKLAPQCFHCLMINGIFCNSLKAFYSQGRSPSFLLRAAYCAPTDDVFGCSLSRAAWKRANSTMSPRSPKRRRSGGRSRRSTRYRQTSSVYCKLMSCGRPRSRLP